MLKTQFGGVKMSDYTDAFGFVYDSNEHAPRQSSLRRGVPGLTEVSCAGEDSSFLVADLKTLCLSVVPTEEVERRLSGVVPNGTLREIDCARRMLEPSLTERIRMQSAGYNVKEFDGQWYAFNPKTRKLEVYAGTSFKPTTILLDPDGEVPEYFEIPVRDWTETLYGLQEALTQDVVHHGGHEERPSAIRDIDPKSNTHHHATLRRRLFRQGRQGRGL
ncbi:MAG: hypothetical protein ABIB47_02475 [Candidatus Woesearchaeota archaeon]